MIVSCFLLQMYPPKACDTETTLGDGVPYCSDELEAMGFPCLGTSETRPDLLEAFDILSGALELPHGTDMSRYWGLIEEAIHQSDAELRKRGL